jgi:SAM-dependent methyltransferase
MQSQEDYRLSHLERGPSYDAVLAETPFDAYMAAWERRHLTDIVQQLFPAGVPRYLDFACGTGRITTAVAPLSRHSVAVDISPSMIEVAKSKLPATAFHLADLTQSQLDIGSFDLITSFRFFGNAQDDLRDKVLRTLVERLAPGGYLVINNHRNPRALYALLDRFTGGDAGGMDLHMPKLRALLERHRLHVKSLKPIGAWMYRSRLLGGHAADDPVAVANERRFGHPALAAISPDVVIVAQRS